MVFLAISAGNVSAQQSKILKRSGEPLMQATAAPVHPPAQRGGGEGAGSTIFGNYCENCHGNPKVAEAPSPGTLRQMSPEKIYSALTEGDMKVIAQSLTDIQKRDIAEWVGGRKLGSSASGECKIDAIAQSWSVISGAADPHHAALAMNALEKHLIRHDDKIALLLTPPFDRSAHDPGYIKAYPPGIRENGGQYTHGAIWSVFAFAALGQGDQAGDLFALLNPIHHSSTPDAVACYRVEPYAACADVYSVAPHVGRGGWTWYTGSAGWLYRAGLEAILGFHVHGDTLAIDPCLPKAWPGYEIVFRHRATRDTVTRYEITVENPRRVSRGVVAAEPDSVKIAQGAAQIPLVDDGRTHRVRIELG